MAEKRFAGKRLKAKLPVLLVGKTPDEVFLQAAVTMDISAHGTCITAPLPMLKIGDVIMVNYHQEHCRFRVVWKQPVPESDNFRIGLECVEATDRIWGLELNSGLPAEQTRLLLCEALEILKKKRSASR